MTVEIFAPAPVYTIATTGPYAIPFEYHGMEEIVVTVAQDETRLPLAANVHFTVSPDAKANSGELTLTAGALSAYDGWALEIARATIVEQGWVAQGGAREAGLVVQLDRLTRAIQDNTRDLDELQLRALRMHPSGPVVPPLLPSEFIGNVLGFDTFAMPVAVPLDITLSSTVQSVDSAQLAALLTPDPASTWIDVKGYSVAGDGGGGLYKRVGSAPAHDGKIQDADGGWWELVDHRPNILQFAGGTAKTGAQNAAAFDRCLAYAKATGCNRAHFPAGEFICDAFATIVDDRGAGLARQVIFITGAGREITKLIYSGNLASPLFDCSPTYNVKYGGVVFEDFSVAGGTAVPGYTGVTFFLSHLSKCAFRRIKVEYVSDTVILAEDWWDSLIDDVYISYCGEPTGGKACVSLADDPIDLDNCNNLSFTKLHIENHQHTAVEIFDGARKIDFFFCKFHQTPGFNPTPPINHVLIDHRNAIGSGGTEMREISFFEPNFAVCSGDAIVVQNTGGAAGEGAKLLILGGSVTADRGYGVKLIKGQAATFSGAVFKTSTTSGVTCVYHHEDYHGVSCPMSGNVFDTTNGGWVMEYAGDGYTNAISRAAELNADGEITASFDNMPVGNYGRGAGVDNLDQINGGLPGQLLTISAPDTDQELKIRDQSVSGGNIKTKFQLSRGLRERHHRITLRRRIEQNIWDEVSCSNGLRGNATYDPPSLADGSGVTTTVSVPGVGLGGGQLIAVSFSENLQGVMVTAWISATDTVAVRFQNETGGTVNLDSGTLIVYVDG